MERIFFQDRQNMRDISQTLSVRVFLWTLSPCPIAFSTYGGAIAMHTGCVRGLATGTISLCLSMYGVPAVGMSCTCMHVYSIQNRTLR